MDTEIDSQQGACSIRFNGDLTVYTVAQCRSSLLDKCPTGSSATVDMSGVGQVDTAGLQLLISMEAYFAAGGGLSLTGVGEGPAKVLELTRLSERFTEVVPATDTE